MKGASQARRLSTEGTVADLTTSSRMTGGLSSRVRTTGAPPSCKRGVRELWVAAAVACIALVVLAAGQRAESQPIWIEVVDRSDADRAWPNTEPAADYVTALDAE